MDVSMGLLAAVFWGVTDFLVGINARLFGVRRSVFFGQLIGLIVMSLILLMSSRHLMRLIDAPLLAIMLGLLAAVCAVAGALALASAFAIGKTALVAPLVTSYGVVTTLIAWVAGETLTNWQFAGVFICVCGVLLVSRRPSARNHTPVRQGRASIIYALAAALCYGTSLWLQGTYALPALGPINMLWLIYIIGVAVLWREVIPMLSRQSAIQLKAYGTLCAASLCNLSGFAAFSLGVMSGSVSIVTVISTLSGGIASVLGYIFHSERLTALQVSGISFVLIGAGLIHLYG